MSFSSLVKKELFRIQPEKHCCMLAELSALTQTSASLRLMGGGRVRVVYETESSDLAKRIFLLLKHRMGITPQLEFNRHKRLGGRRLSILTVPEADSRRLLAALRMIQESAAGDLFKGIPRAAVTRRCCRAAFIRASFLGAGSATSPDREYRLEFVASGANKAETLMKILEKSGISSALTKRRDKDVVYLRRGNDVVTCLTLMGAAKAMMDMENTRISRDARNQANRARNCDEANLKKQLTVGDRQAQAIAAYEAEHGLEDLPPDLREIAEARLEQPEASLEELGQALPKPIGKSGANHRLRRLMALIQPDP